LPVLNQLVTEYPISDEAIRAREMIAIIQNGYSKNIPIDFSQKSPFSYNEKSPQWVIVFLEKNESSSAAKTKVSDFSKEFFSRDKLKVSSKIYEEDQSVILIQEFPTDMKAAEYVRVFKATRKHLMELQKAKIFIIAQDNMKILFEKKNLPEYQSFHNEFY